MKKKILFFFIVIILIGSKFSFAETNIAIKDTIFPPPINFMAWGSLYHNNLSWNEPSQSTYTLIGYNLYRSDIGRYFFFDNTQNPYHDYMVYVCVEYTYWVTAVYSEGESEPSDTCTATPYGFGPEPEFFYVDWHLTGWTTYPVSPNNWEWDSDYEAAKLNWSPSVPNYDMSLISPQFVLPQDSTHIFDLTISMYINDYSVDSSEVMEIWIIHDGQETMIFEWDLDENDDWGSSGGTDWVYTNMDQFAGETIQLKFRSHGEDTFNFNYWYIYMVWFHYLIYPDYGTLQGTVTDNSGNPLENVSVHAEDNIAGVPYYNVLTNENGEYSIDSMMTGIYDITFELEHYNVMVEEDVETLPNQTTILNMIMTAPELIFTPTCFEFQLCNIGDIAIDTLNISNTGTGPVDFTIDINYVIKERPSILCVDRDGSSSAAGYTDVWPYFEAALDVVGYAYTYYEITDLTQDGPDLATMQQYEVIIWFSGESWGYYGHDCMTDNDEINLGVYLEGGGALFLSAHDYLRASYPSAGDFSEGQFPYDYLGMRSVVQDNWLISQAAIGSVEGVDGSLAEGYNFFVQDILYINQFTDNVGEDLFNITNPVPQGICANQFDSGIFKTVFTTASFAAITDPIVQAELIADIIIYLTPGMSYWLTVEPMSGTFNHITTTPLLVTVDTDGLELGNYYADIIVNTDNPDIGQSVIPIHLELSVGVDEIQILSTKLNQNYPNPFNSSTTISFSLSHKNIDDTEIKIYNTKGQLVKTLIPMTNGKSASWRMTTIEWDGKDENGKLVSSGLYFYQLKIEDEIIDTKKCLLMK
ncbi:MAG: carboxypeptidase regulatory-like domain-containing protein [Candidatus Cloacimonadota bacterium]|nr:carboxypeptidase regulatory-like domain-containing protein [Candidatus Cloacimonadota bacterium]